MATKNLGRAFLQTVIRIILIVNLISVGMLWACCATTTLHPSEHSWLALAGLLFPAFLLFELSFVLVWVVLRPKWTMVSIIGVVACFPYVLDYFPMNLPEDVPDDCLKVFSWNCNGFAKYNTEIEANAGMFLDYIRQNNPDMIFLQETTCGDEYMTTFLTEMEEKGYHHHTHNGLLFLSRMPIIAADTLDYNANTDNQPIGNGSMCYWLQDGNDTLIAINNHLESNTLAPDIKQHYALSLEERNIDSLELYGHAMGVIVKDKTVTRAAQADSLVSFIRQNERFPIILCGDLNDTPISYVYQQLDNVLTNAYRRSGRGIGISYNQKGFWVRIDHIFMSQHFRSYRTQVDETIKLSDHYPIMSWMRRQ